MKKKVLALGLSFLMAMSAVACGGDETPVSQGTEQQLPEFVYVPEYFDWGIEMGDNDWMNMRGVMDGYIVGEYQSYDMETYQSVREILMMNVQDRSVTRIPLEFEDPNAYVSAFSIREDGSLVATTETYTYDPATGTSEGPLYELVWMDATGQVTSSADLTELSDQMTDKYGYFYMGNLAVDKDGMVYVTCEQEVLAIHPDGSLAFSVENNNWINNLGNMPDGSVYATYYAEEGYELAVIDPAAKAYGTTYKVGSHLGNSFQISEGNVIYYSDGSSVCKLALETGEKEEIFSWLDSDINGQYVDSIAAVDEEHFIAYYRNWNKNDESFMYMTKTDSGLLPQKTPIIMAAFAAGGSDLQDQIVDFNRQSDTYRISLKTYFDYNQMSGYSGDEYEQYYNEMVTRMMNDIMSNTPPDILVLDGALDMHTLAAKGILEEITPYLESAGYSEQDFMQGVVNSYKVDGKLYTLPTTFSISTQMADSAVVGTEPGWTLDEALEIMKNLPEGMAFQNYGTRQGFVSQTLAYGYNKFVDKANATCNFDSPEFKTILEMAKDFPKEMEDTGEWVSEPVKMQNGELLLASVNIYSLESIQEYMAYLGGKPVTFIGYPGVEGNGSIISAYGSNYGICAKSKVKDVAAEFIVDLLTEEYEEDDYTWGVPTYMPTFEAYVADEIDVEYRKDANGELILDNEGNPIPMEGGHSVGYGDWEYSYRPCTQEDADLLLDLINGSCTVTNYNTDLFGIILEELEPFFNDQKSVDEVASIIQNRINLYLIENS